jgi:hypothetical protein
MFAAVVFIGRRRIIALWLLRRRFHGEQIGVRHIAIEFRHRHARRFWVVRARLHVAFFRRRLNLFRRTIL